MKRFVLCALTAACSPVFADNYRGEIGLSYLNSELSVDGIDGRFFSLPGFSVDTETIGANANVFFNAVDTSIGPLAEAAFLDHASGVGAFWLDVEDAEDNTFGLELRYVAENDFIVEASFSEADGSDELSLGLGWYLNDTTDLVVSYSRNADADADSWSANLHSVVALENGTSIGYTLNAAYLDVGSIDGFGIGANIIWYLTPKFGIGGNLGFTDTDEGDSTTWGISADYFFTDNFRVNAVYSLSDSDRADIEVVGVAASLRF